MDCLDMADILLMNLRDRRIDNTLWDSPIKHIGQTNDRRLNPRSFSYENIKPFVVNLSKDVSEKDVEEDMER